MLYGGLHLKYGVPTTKTKNKGLNVGRLAPDRIDNFCDCKKRGPCCRVWRDGDIHTFVEWMVHTMLEAEMSDNENWFTTGSNEGMTATDTQKNTVGWALYIHRHRLRESHAAD
jgi:urate oxidase